MIPIITPAVMLEEEVIWDIQDQIERISCSGKALFMALLQHITSSEHLIFIIGKGLNGADTLSLAQNCYEAGFTISVMPIYDIAEFKKETNHFYKNLLAYDVIKPFDLPRSGKYIIIDGVFGAGFKGPLHQDVKTVFNKINAANFTKIAIDIPSGIQGDTGDSDGFIECHLTLSVGLPKWGLFVKHGRNASGCIQHVDIGLKKTIAAKKALGFFLVSSSLHSLYPKEKAYYHKYQRGQVLGLASDSSFKGASFLFTKAAYRLGAGIVRLFHESKHQFFNDLTPEVTQHQLHEIDKFLEKQNLSCIIGPGLVITAGLTGAITKILEKQIPCVIDGGAFESLSIKDLHEHSVLTPHVEELKRLLKTKENDFDKLLKFTSENLLSNGETVVIKGHHSWIIHKDKKPVIAASAPPSTATAGSGDVLAGIIGAGLAKNMTGFDAAILGVGIHSLAAHIAVMNQSKIAIIASDLLDALPEALNEIFV